MERYVNSFKGEFKSIYLKIKNLVPNYISYKNCPVELLKYHELNIGYSDSLSSNEASRRKLLTLKPLIDSLKGCERSFEVAYRACGFTVDNHITTVGYVLQIGYLYYIDGDPEGVVIANDGTVDVTLEVGTYVTPTDNMAIVSVTNAWVCRQTIEEIEGGLGTFDDPNRVFDGAASTFDNSSSTCRPFNVRLYGDVTITPEVIRSAYLIARYCKPIDADLVYIYFQNIFLVDLAIEIEVDSEGNLILNNEPDTNLNMLVVNGDLYINGINAIFYAKDINGNLIFNG
jgi:hypothetical protein